MRLLDVSIGPVVEMVIDRAKVSYRLRENFTREFPRPLTYMTMRDRFDLLLVKRAVAAGAELMDGVPVRRVALEDGTARVFSGKTALTARVLVGADGTESIVAREPGFFQNAEVGVGLESEVYAEASSLGGWDRTVGLDFGTIRGGYMWVFPKEDHLSIGVAGFRRFGPKLRDLLSRYLDQLELGQRQERVTRGHRLLRRRQGMPIQLGPALLVGDAAGLVDFWSGEGVYYAVRSAQMAAPAIVEYLEGKERDLKQYEEAVDREIMPELHIARTLTRIGVGLPWLGYRLLRDSDWAWDTGCRLLRGERSYRDVRARLGPLGLLFDLVGVGV